MSMSKTILTKDARALDRAIANGEYESMMTPEQAAHYATIAKNTFAKQRTVNIRISQKHLMKLKAAAAREGVPYQTFVSSLIQKHV